MPDSDHTRRVRRILTEEIERLATQGEDLNGILELAIGISEGGFAAKERQRILIDLVSEVGYFPQYDRMSLEELQEFRQHVRGNP